MIGFQADRRFPRGIRLRKSRDFRRVQRTGKKLTTRSLVILYRDTGCTVPRFGLTVSRKVGNAVVRNRVKRWLREAIRHHRHSVDRNVDIVIIARPSAAGAGARALERQVADGLARLRARS